MPSKPMVPCKHPGCPELVLAPLWMLAAVIVVIALVIILVGKW